MNWILDDQSWIDIDAKAMWFTYVEFAIYTTKSKMHLQPASSQAPKHPKKGQQSRIRP